MSVVLTHITSPALDRLTAIRDVSDNQLYTFQGGMPTLDLSTARPSASYAVDGADGGYDPWGQQGNPMAPRKVTYTWEHLYQKANGSTVPADETFSIVWHNLNIALGGGIQRHLVLTDSTGAEWIALAKMTDVKRAVDLQSHFAAAFAVTWELNPPVFRKLFPTGWFILDNGDTLDETATTPTLDSNTLPSIALTGTSNTGVVTNNGDADDRSCILYLTGPFSGPVVVRNDSVVVNGALMNWTWQGGLQLYQTLVVDCGAGTVRLNGVPFFASPLFTFNQDPIFWIAPGANTVEVILPATGTFGQLGNVQVTGSTTTFSGAPTVTFSGGGGAGATAHAVMAGGAVIAVILDTPGSGYATAPAVVFTGGGGTATATAVVGGNLLVDFRDTRV